MEEDIKVLEEHLKFIKPFDNNSAYIPALENLIAGYKELEEENKNYKIINETLNNIDKKFIFSSW